MFGVSLVFLMTTLGLGLFVSTISATQQQAMLGSFFVILPAIMLSGYVFPVEHMPEPVQWLCAINPLLYYIELVRGLMVKGAPLSALADSLAALTALGAGVLIAASLRFRKRLS
ncbi:MAG: ABC transporter permease [Polyangia bacterium]